MYPSFHLEDYDAFDYEAITIGATAVGFSSAKITLAKSAFLTLETAQIRFRIDGQADPTSTDGHIMDPGDSLILRSPNDIRNFRAIRTGATDGVLRVTYRK